MTTSYQKIIANLVRWGQTADCLRAALMVGSQAREDHPADQYSDLDVILIVDNPDYFVLADDWLKEIGTVHISFSESTFAGGKERRVLFDGALDVDFIFLQQDTPQRLRDVLEDDSIAILRRGYRMLIDHMALQSALPQWEPKNNPGAVFAEQDYINLVNDFWYHCVWAAKKIKRGELWVAKSCVDGYLKQKLLSMIECQAHALHGWGYDTWHSGRFMEQWAEPWVVEKLRGCFADYCEAEIQSALLATMELFRSVAVEAAQRLSYPYPENVDGYASAWVATAF